MVMSISVLEINGEVRKFTLKGDFSKVPNYKQLAQNSADFLAEKHKVKVLLILIDTNGETFTGTPKTPTSKMIYDRIPPEGSQ
jgi:hypothetical protein